MVSIEIANLGNQSKIHADLLTGSLLFEFGMLHVDDVTLTCHARHQCLELYNSQK